MGDLSNEPSMEDILASIKKIISEDSDTKVAPSLGRDKGALERDNAFDAPSLEREPDAAEAEDVLDLNAVDEAAPIIEQPAVIAPLPIGFVSPVAAAASRSAMASLSHLIVKPEVEGTDTLQGMVRDMLKPMLKQWLDENLPEVVERIVAQEVGRISGRVL
jgi:uncharacterized protein